MIAKRLPRTFALRTLLLAMLFCGIFLAAYDRYVNLPPYEVRQVQVGIKESEVLALFGEPRQRLPMQGVDNWVYNFRWGDIVLQFSQGKCRRLTYVYEDNSWHGVDADGHVTRLEHGSFSPYP
jgi:hypothetical protein